MEPDLESTIINYLTTHGYSVVSDDDAYLRSPDGETDKLIPMVVDCLMRESSL